MITFRLFLKTLPWLLVLVAGILLYVQGSFSNQEERETITHHVLLQEIESLGKLELVKYNFQEITELEDLSEKILYDIFQMGRDNKIALVTYGSATGCLDLTRIQPSDIEAEGDTIYLTLPPAELCYYKLDMDKTHIYSLQTDPRRKEKEFIQKAYQLAEQNIKESALRSGILQQTEANAELILKPLLESISKKPVVFVKKPEEISIETF